MIVGVARHLDAVFGGEPGVVGALRVPAVRVDVDQGGAVCAFLDVKLGFAADDVDGFARSLKMWGCPARA